MLRCNRDLHEAFVSEFCATILICSFLLIKQEGDALRWYTKSWGGKPAEAHRLLVSGEHLPSFAMMCTINYNGLPSCHWMEMFL